MNDIGYCHAWHAFVKAAWKKYYRLQCRLRCLQANLDRIDYADFDNLFCELEKVQQDLFSSRLELEQLLRKYDPPTLPKEAE